MYRIGYWCLKYINPYLNFSTITPSDSKRALQVPSITKKQPNPGAFESISMGIGII